jgi:hypothetical protein
MICQPTATRKGKRPNGPGRPRIHLTRGTLACRSAGADAATANPRGPAAAAAHCHRSGRVPTGRDRGGGTPDGDVCATVSWLFAGPGRHRRRRLPRAGPGRDGQVHPAVPGPHRYLHRHPRGGEPARGSTTRPSPGRCWRPAWPSARAAATSARGTPGNAHSAARDMSGPLKAHAQDEVDYAGCITTHLRRWGAARATLVRIR